ncbi:hypothetical protein [Streptomyces sp. TE33382]
MGVVGHGAVWFKANPPAGAFEAALTSALSQWVPEHVLEPLAVDVGHGWSLLPDGGDSGTYSTAAPPIRVPGRSRCGRTRACGTL